MVILGVCNLALIALAAFLILEVRHQSTVIEAVARAGSPDLKEMVALVDRLCQRIQAPEAAVMQHAAQGPLYAPQHVPLDNDEEYHQSKEELADLLAEATRVGG
jgi:hypothetical protein